MPGNGSVDNEKVPFRLDPENHEILNGLSFISHVAGQPRPLEHP